MAVLTVAAAARSGLTLAQVAAAAGGDKMPNTGKEILVITNASVGAITLSFPFAARAAVDGVAPAAKTAVVGAGATVIAGPFPPEQYNNASEQVDITYSGVTTLTVQAVRVGA